MWRIGCELSGFVTLWWKSLKQSQVIILWLWFHFLFFFLKKKLKSDTRSPKFKNCRRPNSLPPLSQLSFPLLSLPRSPFLTPARSSATGEAVPPSLLSLTLRRKHSRPRDEKKNEALSLPRYCLSLRRRVSGHARWKSGGFCSYLIIWTGLAIGTCDQLFWHLL